MEKFKIVKNSQQKHEPINLGDIIAQYMATDSVNKIDSRKFNGLDNLRSPKLKKLKDLLYRSNFVTERSKAGNLLSLYGKAFMVITIYDNKEYISFYKIKQGTEFKKEVLSMVAESNEEHKLSNEYGQTVKLQICYEWKKVKGRIVKIPFGWDKEDKKRVELIGKEDFEVFTYPKKFKNIPGRVIYNEPTGEPDWERVEDILRFLNTFSNEPAIEWENIKTQWQTQKAFGGKQNPKQTQRNRENGERTIMGYSLNGLAGNAEMAIISGSNSLEQLLRTLVMFEDRAMKYAFQGRDSDSSGSNKHNLQVGLFNQAHSEYLQTKKEQRERDYFSFFKDIVQGILGIQVPERISIESTAFEKGKRYGIELSEEQKKLLSAQAKLQKAAADKNVEETKNIGNEKSEKNEKPKQ